MKKKIVYLLMMTLLLECLAAGCGTDGKAKYEAGSLTTSETVQDISGITQEKEKTDTTAASDKQTESVSEEKQKTAKKQKKSKKQKNSSRNKTAEVKHTLNNLPEYLGEPYVEINDNVPYFEKKDFTSKSFESYEKLDSLGRCGVAYACVGTETMPQEERGAIGQVKPSGWHTVKYDIVEGKYLYNRCHLIGYQLTAENANERNLITGTRYFNTEGMLPFENMVADYVKETGNHVLYRVTPVFKDENLVAQGVLMEAESVEDSGDGICYNVFVYNIQPGISIDYASGESSQDGSSLNNSQNVTKQKNKQTQTARKNKTNSNTEEKNKEVQGTYILNTNTKKFHYPGCRSVKITKEENKQNYSGDRQTLIDEGYEPCLNCNP